MNFFGTCDAPPIRNPSIISIFFKSLIFFGFTDPPYKTFVFLTLFLIKLTVSSNSDFFGIKPVPIAQTGS